MSAADPHSSEIAAAPPRLNGQAAVALALGILGLFVCMPLGIVAVFMGRSAQRRIAASHGAESGRGIARAAVVLGVAAVVIWALTILAIVVFTDLGRSTEDTLGIIGAGR
jgi:hypothetical protein